MGGVTVSPGEFIPVAEASGLTARLTYIVLAQSVRAIDAIQESTSEPLTLSVNLSMQDLHTVGFGDHLVSIANELGARPEALIFEVTETAIMRDPEQAIGTLCRLREEGFGISIDDFGTGYSSLSYVDKIPATELKIDKSLVDELTRTNAATSVVATAIAIAKTRRLHAIAEGVESEEQHAALNDLGCEIAQGYLYGKPMPVSEFLAIIAR